MFNLLLLVASFLSFLSGFISNDPSSIQMGIAILVVVIINIIFSLFQEYRAEKAVQVIKSLNPHQDQGHQNGSNEGKIAVTDAVPGDILASKREIECQPTCDKSVL